MSDFGDEERFPSPSHYSQMYENKSHYTQMYNEETLKASTIQDAAELDCYTPTLDRVQAENILSSYCAINNVSPIGYFLVRYSTSEKTIVIMVYHDSGFLNHVCRYRLNRSGMPVIYFRDKRLFHTPDNEPELEFRDIKSVVNTLEIFGYHRCILK